MTSSHTSVQVRVSLLGRVEGDSMRRFQSVGQVVFIISPEVVAHTSELQEITLRVILRGYCGSPDQKGYLRLLKAFRDYVLSCN